MPRSYAKIKNLQGPYAMSLETQKEFRRHPIHPDGKAWPKMCRHDKNCHSGDNVNCAFIDGRLKKSDDDQCKDHPFVCAHRKDDNCFRVCSGWDKWYGEAWKKARRKTPKEKVP
jgi:hypothetical protein